MKVPSTIIPRFIAFHRCYIFYKLKARPFTSKEITAGFVTVLALMRWSGTEPAVSPGYTYMKQ